MSKHNNNFSCAWPLIRAYWQSEEKVSAYIYLGIVIALTLLLVAGNVILTYWQKYFWDAIQHYEVNFIWKLLGVFCLIVTVYLLFAVYQYYLQSLFVLRWRRWLTKAFTERWTQPQLYYYLENFDDNRSDNPDQRLQEDVDLLTTSTMALFLGIVNAVTTLPSFMFILWHISGAVKVPLGSLGHLTIDGYLVWLALIYSIGGTYITHLIGRPLIRLNFLKQRREADFRFQAVRLRNNAENIALYHAEKTEAKSLLDNFKHVYSISFEVIKKQKQLLYFTVGFGQAAIIIPVIAALPLYFAKKIGLGGIQQVMGSFAQVQNSFSFIVTAYPQIAAWRATTVRLTGFAERLNQAEALEHQGQALVRQQHDQSSIVAKGLTIDTQHHHRLFDNLNITFERGQHYLIQAPSGTGKTTLIRTLAGIWPFAQGEVSLPRQQKVMYLPQRCYLPLGPLRDIILYPDKSGASDDSIKRLLVALNLQKLTDQLDQQKNWTEALSLGEQQRIAFARIILQQPDWVFLDESTSSLDDKNERNVYQLLKQYLPHCTVISVAHRDTAKYYHDVVIKL